MQHRHIDPTDLTLAAIDDIIERGSMSDWVDLAAAALRSTEKRSDIAAIADHGVLNSEWPQRHGVWKQLCSRLEKEQEFEKDKEHEQIPEYES